MTNDKNLDQDTQVTSSDGYHFDEIETPQDFTNKMRQQLIELMEKEDER
jgi:hypothetical protein